MTMLLSSLQVLLSICSLALAATIKGKLELGPFEITNRAVVNTHFKLYSVGNNSFEPFAAEAQISDVNGSFVFTDVPVLPQVNSSTYYVLHSLSLDFNLKPNRILIELTNVGEGEPTIKAYKNIFGKEYFPSPEIMYPESLEEIAAYPYITISTINKAPLRMYVQQRNVGMFQSGPLASIVNSKYKMAGVITVIMMLLFPMVLEKLDPETAKAVKEERIRKQREKYETKKVEQNSSNAD